MPSIVQLRKNNNMYVVLVSSKSKAAMTDLIATLSMQFPAERFTVEGSEEKGYNARIEGIGDERAPRAVAVKFLKTWKPTVIIEQPVFAKDIVAEVVMVPPIKFDSKSKFDEMLKSILPK